MFKIYAERVIESHNYLIYYLIDHLCLEINLLNVQNLEVVESITIYFIILSLDKHECI